MDHKSSHDSLNTSSKKANVLHSGKLSPQLSRLQMHAPTSIQVAPPPPAEVAGWNIVIPLLSPLDIGAIPCMTGSDDVLTLKTGERSTEVERSSSGADDDGLAREPSQNWLGWDHPAEPFYYEPVPGNKPVFLLPHCA